MAKNKPHSYHHLTPQTYMNGWKHVKDKIYTVEKYGDNHAVRTSTKNIAGEDYFYSPFVNMYQANPHQNPLIFNQNQLF